jgi:ribonuclease HI
VFQILFEVSNNEAECEALLHGLRLAVSLGIKQQLIYGDSLLVVQQVNKEWDVNKDTMEIHHVIRDNNVGADVLSKLGFDRANVPPGVFVRELHIHPSRHQIQAPPLRVQRNLTERS